MATADTLGGALARPRPRPKWGRMSQREEGWDQGVVARAVEVAVEALHDVTFPAAVLGLQVDDVLDGRAPADVVDGFRTRCKALAECARRSNREMEIATGWMPADGET